MSSTLFSHVLPSVEGLVNNGDTIVVTAVATSYSGGRNTSLAFPPVQIDATPPVHGVVNDLLPVRSDGSDDYHPSVTMGSSSDDSSVDIDFHSNPDTLMCAFSAANDPDTGVDVSGYAMYV
jgi:hypothetical protein